MIFGLGYPDDGTSDRDAEASANPSHPRNFLFVGTMARSIDLETVIGAAKLLKDRPDIRIVIVGSGEREPALREAAAGLSNVEFKGWATQQQIQEYAQGAYVGLAAYARGALMSLPNKIYEYMRFGLPILCSLSGEAEDLMRTSGAGMPYDAGDCQDLANKMARLVDDQELRNNMAAAARSAFRSQFSENAIYPRLAERLEQLAGDPIFNDHQKAS
jgi:glycosyltransferase involved in cell wall biosynthesis